MKEIGGYFGLERGNNSDFYHKNPILLNSARNALRYIVKAYRIKKIFIPYYTCPFVFDALKSERCNIERYDIDKNCMPIARFHKDAFIVYNNYFGVFGNNVKELAKIYRNLIVDNAHSFYSMPRGLASFYSPRKFFGLSDGGFVISKNKLTKHFVQDVSYTRMSHLLKRTDIGAAFGYDDFKKNEKYLINKPIKTMSNLTRILLGNIDYLRVKTIRKRNFDFLHSKFKQINELKFNMFKDDIPMVYPLLIKNKNIRHYLIKNSVYVATYWNDIEERYKESSFGLYLSKYLLPLPIDQRYLLKDMQRISDVIKARLN
ncbi:MAG: hypothetical protein LBT79_04540 [Elusimicrobiota bacterium]|jgi:hypothetical protein|nr:hypothetical protein [Elusimicrobiota bacterium]